MNKFTTFSANMLETYAKCPKMYEFAYVKKIRISENLKNTQIGSDLHALINYYLKKQDVTKLLTVLDEKEKELWNNFKSFELSCCKESEYTFFTRFEDVWLTGRIDAVFEENENYLIADWKTSPGLIYPKQRFQTVFYLYSLYEIYKSKGLIKDFSQISMSYFVLPQKTRIDLKFDKAIYKEFCEKLKTLLISINKEDFTPIESEHCKNCVYKSFCRVCNSVKIRQERAAASTIYKLQGES